MTVAPIDAGGLALADARLTAGEAIVIAMGEALALAGEAAELALWLAYSEHVSVQAPARRHGSTSTVRVGADAGLRLVRAGIPMPCSAMMARRISPKCAAA